MDNINLTLDNGWKIEAEHDGEKYHIYLESRCGNFGGSLAMAEDCGTVEHNRYDYNGKEKRVPKSVMLAALKLEDELYEMID